MLPNFIWAPTSSQLVSNSFLVDSPGWIPKDKPSFPSVSQSFHPVFFFPQLPSNLPPAFLKKIYILRPSKFQQI